MPTNNVFQLTLPDAWRETTTNRGSWCMIIAPATQRSALRFFLNGGYSLVEL